jgi:hypothetical protein
MSSEAVYWLATQGAAVQVPSSQAIGEARAWRVLANLAAHANEQTGELWVSDRTQEKETGIPRRLIREARALFIETGLLVDAGKTRTKGVKVYALHLPGYSWRGVDSPSSGQGSGQASGQGSGQDSLPQTEQNLNTPLPPTTGTRSERDKTPRGGGKEWGERHDQVEALCFGIERSRTRGEPGPGLLDRWRKEYRPVITAALRDRPGLSNEVLARECATVRAGETAATLSTPTAPQPRADCPDCKGNGWWGQKTPDGTRRVSCPCATGEPTHKRVTAERAPNTSTPGPDTPADPRSDPAGELAKRLRRVV